MTVGPAGAIYVIGGLEQRGQQGIHGLGRVDRFNPHTSKWTIGAPLPTPRGLLAAALGPDGRIYAHTGKLDFVNNVLAQDTDTLTVRGVIPNPVLGSETAGGVNLRELIADEFVTVLLESVKPREVIAIPRAAILSDQEGSYVYVVDDHNIARQRRVRLGQLTPETAGIADGLKEGELVIVEGIQKVRPGQVVTATVVPGN